MFVFTLGRLDQEVMSGYNNQTTNLSNRNDLLVNCLLPFVYK